jgi:hypothetical protein
MYHGKKSLSSNILESHSSQQLRLSPAAPTRNNPSLFYSPTSTSATGTIAPAACI